jgi:pimeloyl-ACP methyl ester carboxylesterase
MTSVQANSITLEYDERGSGDPLLLVMGLGGQLVDWPDGLVDLLAERFRVIRFDNRDAGLSTEFTSAPPTTGELAKAVLFRRPMRAEYQLADMAHDAIGLLDALGIDSAHVVGMSMGGMIAQTMAIEYPERVRSLTSIMSTTGNWRVGRPKLRIVLDSVRRPVPTPETAVDLGVEVFRPLCGPTFDEVEFRRLAERSVARSFRPAGSGRQTAAILASPDRTESLRRLRVPALVIHGLLDPLVRPSGGIATAQALPGARLVMFNDMGHDLPITRWNEIADEISAIADRALVPFAL